MSPATEAILRAALALPEQERTELIDELLAAQTGLGGLPFDPRWLGEFRRRSAEIDLGKVHLTSWAEVRERARARVKGNPDG